MNSGVRGLFYVRAVMLGWYVLSAILWSFLPALVGSSMELVFRVNAGLWLILDGAQLAVAVPYSRAQKGAAEAPARALVMLLVVGLIVTVVETLPELGGPALLSGAHVGEGAMVAQRLLFLAAEVSLWLSLTRSTPSTMSPAFYSLLALSTVLGLLPVLLAHETYFEIIRHPLWRWGRMAVGVALQALPLLLLKRLLDGEALPSSQPQAVPTVRSPGQDIAVGAAWLGGGLLITLISYSAAASSSGGGRYLVTTGAIAYGLVRLVRGLVRLGG